MTGQPMEYERILKIWSICLLITILGQMSGIFAGVVFGTEVFLLMYFFLFNIYTVKRVTKKKLRTKEMAAVSRLSRSKAVYQYTFFDYKNYYD